MHTLEKVILQSVEKLIMKPEPGKTATDLYKLLFISSDPTKSLMPDKYLFYSANQYLPSKTYDVKFDIKFDQSAKTSKTGRLYVAEAMKVKFVSATEVK